MAKRLYLIDGTALAYRSFFAFANAPRGSLTTKDGRPTGAIYGFLSTLRSLLDREKPDAIAISFDGATADLERTKIYPEYKSTRDKMPDELTDQLNTIEDVTKGYGIRIAQSPGQEADDVIGTLAVKARDAGMEVMIVTGDKDFMQLVDDKVKLYNLRSSTTAPEIIGSAEVEKKFGVRPDQIIDLLALMGDSSDNIPGVPRVGQKTAAALLHQFDTLDAALANAEDVKQPSIRKNLIEFRDQALLSRDLVTIRTDAPLDLELEDIGPPELDREVLEPLFVEFEFTTLLKTLPQEQKPKIDTDYHTVRTSEQLEDLVARLHKAGRFAMQIETNTPVPHDAKLIGISFSWQPGKAWYVPFNLDPALDLDRLRPILEDEKLEKTFQDSKLATAVLRNQRIELRGVEFDTGLASYCVEPGVQGGHDLATLALRHHAHTKTPKKDLLGTGKRQKTFDEIDVDSVGEYVCEDADLTWRIRESLEPALEEYGVTKLYRGLEMPLVPVLLDMEWEGVRIDLNHLAALSEDLGERLANIETRVYERAGEPFNLNAPAQIGAVLFDKLEVHKIAGVRPKKTKTGQWKTDAAMLDQLAEHHEVPELILAYRHLSKLKSTYVDSLPTMVNEKTGRIHTTFNQTVAATGRLSSDHPNLQNIPIRTEEGQKIRRAFIPRDGWTLISADYSQIELRILAHLSSDPSLVKSFNDREDIHARTAALVHGMMPEMVGPELRNQAKIVNYGLMYGMGASRLARETGMKPPDAKKFINAYFRALPKVKEFLDVTLEKAREEHVVHTMFGRRRPLPEIDSTNAMVRIGAENMAVNTPMQGTAADIIKFAMLKLHARLQETGLQAKLLLQVHDELVLEAPLAETEQTKDLVTDCMENAVEISVPLEVSIGHGANWLEAH